MVTLHCPFKEEKKCWNCSGLSANIKLDTPVLTFSNLVNSNFRAASVAEWLRMLVFSALNHSLSHRYGFEPSSASQVLFAGSQVGFLGDLPFSPHLTIDSA